ncbi:hypothetical protein [Citrobacter portucalensis]|uniref:hypothetical protein n=1 Tax=Citrobacter portucalensis TaxID=1639133 RepID=UPI002B234585|nr:hypothetical protein [Citrobacter portucalensis]MEB0772550.1 hypothetical protein [Citrobacter portucalensis]MEB0839286.1 hypothetical protein [Citrobacter portucalensis]
MTKKKEPNEQKKRGRKPKEHDNAELQDHLKGVRHLNQLTDEARRVISNSVKNYFEKNTKRKTFANKNMLLLVTSTRHITDESIHNNIVYFDAFEQDHYSASSVRDYKMITISICEGLDAIRSSGKPVRSDTPEGAQYLTGEEAFRLREAIDSGLTKADLLKIIASIYPELQHSK